MTLNDLFPDCYEVAPSPTKGGVFYHLSKKMPEIPWQSITDVHGVSSLDLLFHSLYGQRRVTPFACALHAKYEDDGEYLGLIASVLAANFSEPWKRLFDALDLKYNPLENYSMKERMTDDHTAARKSESKSESNASTVESARGYNETIPKAQTGQTTGAQSGGRNSEENAEKTVHTGERSGNIGVTTSQQMLQSEIDIRKFNVFRDRIFQDIANYITLTVY